MKRTLSFSVLISNWIVGFCLFFLFPTEINTQESKFTNTILQDVKVEISESFQAPESVNLEIEWKLQFFSHSGDLNWFPDSSRLSHNLFSVYTSHPLFDVKKLFIHFFHTW